MFLFDNVGTWVQMWVQMMVQGWIRIGKTAEIAEITGLPHVLILFHGDYRKRAFMK